MDQLQFQKVKELLDLADDIEVIKQHVTSLSEVINNQRIDPTRTGLDNLGNTCFMNSILQCLRYVTILTQQLMDHKTQFTLMNTLKNMNQTKVGQQGLHILLLINYMKIVDMMNSGNNELCPMCFRILLGRIDDQFNNPSQQDSHEFLVTLLQSFHDSLSTSVIYEIHGPVVTDLDQQIHKAHLDWIAYYKNKNSMIVDLFGGQLRTEIRCVKCQNVTSRYDPIMIIDLPIVLAQHVDLYQCFEHSVAIEQSAIDNLYLCEVCHTRTQALQQRTLWKLPPVLVIKLTRFQQHFINGTPHFKKIDQLVDYPLRNLDLSPFVSYPLQSNKKYHLYAICCHSGAIGLGHYYSVCYDPKQDQWINYSDTTISSCHPESLNDAYMFFYVRNDLVF